MTERKVGENKGNAGKGRPKGSPNKTTALLKDAIVKAAELTGRNGEGAEGLIGYCRKLAVEQPKAFAGLMGKVLPMQVTGDSGEGPIRIVIQGDDKGLL